MILLRNEIGTIPKKSLFVLQHFLYLFFCKKHATKK